MTLEDFKNKKKPKNTSKLAKFHNEIMELYELQYSQLSIVEFLESKNIKATQQNVSRYIQSHLNKSQKNKTQKAKVVEKVSKEKPKPKQQQQKQDGSSKKSLFEKSEVDDVDYSFKQPAANLR